MHLVEETHFLTTRETIALVANGRRAEIQRLVDLRGCVADHSLCPSDAECQR